ncbi:MAG: serine protease, partial [Gaiellaceae bacterium]
MTARHVVRGACRVKVVTSDGSFRVTRIDWWSTGAGNGRVEDLATMRVARRTSGYVFSFRRSPSRVGMNLAMLGHPLGNQVSLTQGRVMFRSRIGRVPVIFARLLGAQGASGSPLVDNNGEVVGVLQVGLGGGETSGLVGGIDLSRWWGGRAEAILCREYPRGGVPGCEGDSSPDDEDEASSDYTVTQCWVQHLSSPDQAYDPSRKAFSIRSEDLL